MQHNAVESPRFQLWLGVWQAVGTFGQVTSSLWIAGLFIYKTKGCIRLISKFFSQFGDAAAVGLMTLVIFHFLDLQA